MADPAVAGATVATDTDYGLEAMDTAFIGRMTGMADRHAQVQSDSESSSAQGFARLQALAENWLGEFESSMAGIKAAAFNEISASTSDSILNYIVMGSRLSNSPNPSVPSGPPYYPFGQGSGQLVGSQGGVNSSGVDLGVALQAIAAKLTAIAAKIGA